MKARAQLNPRAEIFKYTVFQYPELVEGHGKELHKLFNKNHQKVAFACVLGARKYAENRVARLSSIGSKVLDYKNRQKGGGCHFDSAQYKPSTGSATVRLNRVCRSFMFEVRTNG